MSYDPGSPYSSPMGPTGSTNQVAMGKVAGPAIGLMVVGGIDILLALLNVVQGAVGMGQVPPPPPPEVQNDPNALQMYNLMTSLGGPIGLGVGVVGLIIGALVLLGGIKMKGLQSRGLAMTASILAMIPCFGCCLLGLPIGIWSLVTLNGAEVKSAYR